MDERFSHIRSDPRYRRIPKKFQKVKIDKRFKGVLTDERFKLNTTVDKRGRPLLQTSKEDLKKFYAVSDSEESEKDNNDESNISDEEKSKPESVPEELEKQKNKIPEKKIESEEEEDDDSSESSSDESSNEKSLDFARGIGNVSTSDDSSSESEEELDHKWGEDDATVERTDITSNRLAICNVDWDNMKAVDLLVLCNSFKPSEAIINSVSIYPSEYGKERMKIEEEKGPPELINDPLPDNDDESELIDDSNISKETMENFRKYQLNRLKYFYAIVECDSPETANKLYEELDGKEFEGSGSCLDLRFVPDGMMFDEAVHDSANALPDAENYKPSKFITTALQQSTVRITWDQTDSSRSQLIQSAFKEDDAKLSAILASSSSGSSSEEEAVDSDEGGAMSQMSSKDERIAKYRALLETIQEKDKDKDDMHMEISWEPDLKEAAEEIVKKKNQEQLTPFEQILEKKKEKLKARKMKNAQPVEEEQPSTETEESEDEIPAGVDLNDSYFQDEIAKHKKPNAKKVRFKKNDELVDPKAQAELELLMDDDEKQHFSLKKLIKENKKRKKKVSDEKNVKDNFHVDVKDDRFSALYTSHLFNIDPSDPHYRSTKGIEDIVQEKQKRQTVTPSKPNKESSEKDDTLTKLVNDVKKKTANFPRKRLKKS